MKKEFVEPELEVITFEANEMICSSSCDICDGYQCTADGDSCCMPKWIG